MATIGQRLAAERARLGLNQTDFSASVGCGRASQVNYETNKRSPDADYLAAAAGWGVDVQYVITGVRSQNAGGAADEAPDRLREAKGLALALRAEFDRLIRLLG